MFDVLRLRGQAALGVQDEGLRCGDSAVETPHPPPSVRAGGTFALYSLLKRQAGLGVRGKAMASDRLLKQYSMGPATSPSNTLSWARRSMRRRPIRVSGARACS